MIAKHPEGLVVESTTKPDRAGGFFEARCRLPVFSFVILSERNNDRPRTELCRTRA